MAARALFNSVVNWFIKQRMDQIENFMHNPLEVQQNVLFSHVLHAENTEYGKLHGFSSIGTLEDFQQQVPLVTYEEFEPFIEKARQGNRDVIWPGAVKNFAKSSGTTNARSKFIPITQDSLEKCHLKAGKDMVALYVNNHPENQLFSNRNLRLGGSAELYEEFGTRFGDLSAIIIDNLPIWVEITTTPSKKVSLMSEWETKLTAITQEVIHAQVGSLTGVPSWMLVLLQRVLAVSGKKSIKELWPNLEVFFHGGINMAPYRSEYRRIMGQDINYYETYNASEGFFGIQDQKGSEELLLMLDYGIFYEFIPMEEFGQENPKVVTLAQVELGKNYSMVITTNGGLWRYIIGDTVVFTSLHPFRIKISGRTKHYINAFGEELMIGNVEAALMKASQDTDSAVGDFTGAPIFMTENTKGGHEWMIEFSRLPADMERFTQSFDAHLRSLNSDYDAKRYRDMTLTLPKIHIARPNLFYDWMAQRGKLGGQNKVPRLSNERTYLEELLKLNAANP